MRILISSNGVHTTTGYANQAKLLGMALRAQGHDVRFHAWYGLSGGAAELDGFICYPRLMDHFGGDTSIVALHFKADLVITVQDVWPLPENYGDLLPCPWAAWVPVDGWPLDPDTKKRLASCAYPVAMSEFGYEVMAEAGIASTYIPHGVDPSHVIMPNRADLRSRLGISPDNYMILVVAANNGYPSRKSLPEILDAFSHYYLADESAVLYLHTMIQPGGDYGLDLIEIMQMLGIPLTAVKYTNQHQMLMGINTSFITQLYNAADVLLMPSAGEGFGLPIIEAQACGTPVITQACSSMPELTQHGISIVAGQRFYSAVGRFHHIPKVSRIVDALGYVRNECDPVNEAASQWVHQNYGWDSLAGEWQQLVERIQRDTQPPVETAVMAEAGDHESA